MTRAESIHLTLAFLGDVDLHDLNRLLDPPDNIASSPFVLTLDEWGCWPRNGIGWAMPIHAPDVLFDLAANLERWLRGAGFALEHRAFVPHVTLLRKVECVAMPRAMTPVIWSVDAFVLVQSSVSPQGSRYKILQHWPLKCGDDKTVTSDA
jgi:2'-5' RNA ligase